MPSPLGHCLAGLTLSVLSQPRPAIHSWRRIAIVTAAALAPDLDLLLRLFDGRNHHQNQVHSVGFAMLAALFVLAVARWRGWEDWAGLGLGAGLGWLSHLGLDYLSVDTHPPIGLMALWPFSTAHFNSPWPLFLDIGRTLEWGTVRHDALAMAWEAALLGSCLALGRRLRASRRG